MPLLTCPAQPGSLLSIRQMRTVEETILLRPHQAQSPLWSDLAFPFFPLSLTLVCMPSISKRYSSTAPFLEESQNINPTLTLNPRVAKKDFSDHWMQRLQSRHSAAAFSRARFPSSVASFFQIIWSRCWWQIGHHVVQILAREIHTWFKNAFLMLGMVKHWHGLPRTGWEFPALKGFKNVFGKCQSGIT